MRAGTKTGTLTMTDNKFKIDRIKERRELSHFPLGADNSICNLVVEGRNK